MTAAPSSSPRVSREEFDIALVFAKEQMPRGYRPFFESAFTGERFEKRGNPGYSESDRVAPNSSYRRRNTADALGSLWLKKVLTNAAAILRSKRHLSSLSKRLNVCANRMERARRRNTRSVVGKGYHGRDIGTFTHKVVQRRGLILSMFRSGYSIRDIARTTGLARMTIQTHLRLSGAIRRPPAWGMAALTSQEARR